MEVTQAEQAAVVAVMPPAERAALALNSSQTERDLRELATKHTGLCVIKDKAGRDQVHNAAMEVKRARTTIERVGKEARDDATKFSKAVIAEQNRLIAIIEPEEERLLTLRDGWDVEQERIKAEQAAAERLRVEQIRARIEAVAAFERLALNCRTSAAIERLQDSLAKTDLAGLDEFEAEALQLHATMTQRLIEIHAERQADEAERARVKAEQEAEAKRIAEERAELDRQRAEAAAAAQAARVAAKAEADRIAAERAALEAARAEFEQRQKAHDELERAEREAATRVATAEAAQPAAHQLIDEDGDVPLIADLSATTELTQPTAPVEVDDLADAVPSAAQLILAVAETFGAPVRDAQDWLIQRAVEIEAAIV